MKPIRSSKTGGIMRCRAFLRISEQAVIAGSDVANLGSAFAEVQRRHRLGQSYDQINYDDIKAEFALTEEEVADIRKLAYNGIQCDFADWELTPERELACNEKLEPVEFKSKDAFLTGHPDVLAIHRTMRNVAQIRDDKSGQLEQWDELQLLSYIALVLSNYPQIDTIDAVYDYHRLGFSTRRKNADGSPRAYTRSEFTTIYWPRMVAAFNEAKKWRANNNAGYQIGVQCARCCPWSCKAWEQFRLVLAQGGDYVSRLSPHATAAERAAFVVDSLPKIRVLGKAVKVWEGQVKLIGKMQTIELGDGMLYGNRPQTVTTIDGAKAMKTFVEITGSVENVGKAYQSFSRGDLSKMVRFAFPKMRGVFKTWFEKLTAIGAVETKTRDRVEIHAAGEVTEEEGEE